jgi:hypothetical protein
VPKGIVIFKYEDEEPDGTPVGPVWIEHYGDDPKMPKQVDKLEQWMRLPEAERIARERGFEFVED